VDGRPDQERDAQRQPCRADDEQRAERDDQYRRGVDAATVAQQHDQQRGGQRETDGEAQGQRGTNSELLQERVHHPAAGADRQQRQQRERRGVGEGEDMHQPRHPNPVRVGEVVRAARVGGHPLVEAFIAADPMLVAQQKIGQAGQRQAEDGRPHWADAPPDALTAHGTRGVPALNVRQRGHFDHPEGIASTRAVQPRRELDPVATAPRPGVVSVPR
jgi:hypothetical protein